MHEFDALRSHFDRKAGYTRDITAGTVEASYETDFDRVGTEKENDRDCLRRRLGRRQRWGSAAGYDHRHASSDQIGYERR
jgi:hypothetical protein